MALLLAGCVSTPARPQPTLRQPGAAHQPGGLRFQLSPANAASDASQALPQVSPTPLSDSELKPLLKRLPPLQVQPDDQKPFALREGSKPPPRTARSLEQPFPPPANRKGPPPVPADLPLKVLSVSPQGEVSMAPHLQITFNQPMVPVASVEELEAGGVPVKLTPATPGKWRWLGTQVLMFEPELRFPMATEFRLEVPAGTTSASSMKLAQAEEFKFSTPPLTLEQSFPNGGPQILNPLLFMSFNQDMDPARVAPLVRLSGAPGVQLPGLRLATAEEVALDDQIQAQTQGAGKKRSLVLVPAQKLQAGQSYTVELLPGLPSLEGPRLSRERQGFSFSTFDPLKIVWKTDKTQPLQSWTVNFNNGLDKEKFDPKWVRVQPELPALRVRANGSNLTISGRSKGRTDYQVSIASPLADQFGQILGHEEKFTVKVGSAEPAFTPPNRNFLVLDPKGPRQLTVQVMNYPKVKVKAWKVTPKDWAAYLEYLQNRGRNLKDHPVVPPGIQVLDTVVETKAPVDEQTDVSVDLSKAFDDKGHGQLIVRMEPDPQEYPEEWRRQIYYGWLEATDIGLDATHDGHQMVAWVSDLATGKSLPGVEVQLWPQEVRAQSDEQGLARLTLPASASLLVARRGEDIAILPRDFNYWGSSTWNFSHSSDSTLWHVLDDRKLYKPGEKVNLKGWLRVNQYGPQGDLVASPVRSLTYQLYDSMNNEISKGSTRVGALGGFHFEVPLPKTINLGQTRLALSSDRGDSYSHAFQVEEFRRPEFEVSAEANPGSSQIGSHSLLTAGASYFSGGPLNNAKVDWVVSSSPTSYSPPGWEGFTFGTWTPWWPCRCWWNEFDGGVSSPQSNTTTQETRTDSKGKSTLQVNFLSADPPQPFSLSAQATVQDVNRQSWTSSTSVLVHPCSLYVGLKSARTFVEPGQPLELSMIVSDLDGKAVAGRPVQIRAYRLGWDDEGRSLAADETRQTVTSKTGPVPFQVATREGGTYQVEARLQDDDNRSNYSQMTLWVAGGKQPPNLEVAQESITLVPGKQEYQAGDTAEVLVQTPFAPAELLVTTRRNGLAKVERMSAPEGSATLRIPLEEYQIPGLTVQVDAVGNKAREDGKTNRPAYASGSLTLNLSQAPRKLTVKVKPALSKLEPGGSTQVALQLQDYRGKPVEGEVTLIMVDESVLALTGYDPANPLGSFCPLRSSDCYDQHLRQYLTLAKVEIEDQTLATSDTRAPGMVDEEMAPPAPSGVAKDGPAARGGGQAGEVDAMKKAKTPMAESAPSGKNEVARPQFKVRTNFTPLALFAPNLKTDSTGKVVVPVKLPDNLTRYRLIALAAAGVKQFGKGESSLVARQALMVRPSPPRFLNFGDRFEMPLMVQNQTDQPMQVALACRGSNARVGEARAAGYRVEVPANDRVEVRIPCATDQAGTARFQFAASSDKADDAAEVSLPVWTPATTEAFATYGILDQGASRQPLQMPHDVWPQFGGLTVTTSSTALSELSDAFLYLTSYPFECSEQISSRMLAAAALKDVLQAFEAPGMASPEALKASMKRDLDRLRSQQNDDGGWDYWVRGQESVPYLSVHVAHTLVRCKAKGFAVDEGMLAQAIVYLQDVESHIPASYSTQCRRAIRAYALYVLNLNGTPDPAKARQLIGEASLEKLGFETIGWLLPSLAKDPASAARCQEIYQFLNNHSTQTASTAEFSASYSDQGYLVLYSDRRDDGLLLESLIETQPKNPLIPKLVRGLLDHRSAGRWENTQENCWVLLALDRYFHQYESVTPNFVASLWLGQGFAGEQKFRGRDKDEKVIHIPLSQVKGALTVAKEGPGRLYYRIGLNYSPKSLKQAPADYGFTVQRRYEAIADNRDVIRGKDGTWHIKAGSEVKVTVTMQAPSRRYHVALVDPLPAGLEALNPALLGNGNRAQAPQNRQDGWWTQYWYQHQNLRDERVEAFTQLLWEGVYTYSYVARATTPGTFVVPPAKAEEMYHPETFGRSGSDRVVIE